VSFGLKEKTYDTPKGCIHYWTNEIGPDRASLVFLPGLTADHSLFDLQIPEFGSRYNVLVWDAPGHAASRPFELDFNLSDKAAWLNGILAAEGILKPVLVGQSMGGYVSQAYLQMFPGSAAGFVSIDSAPLKKKYYPRWELWLLHHVESLYRMYPWDVLVRQGARGTAESRYGRDLMAAMMRRYDDDPRYYSRLVGHGYGMLADAIEEDLPYDIGCPSLLICGEKDRAGDTRAFNRLWAAGDGLRLEWIPDAGHNANTDRADLINALVEKFLSEIDI